MAKRLRRGHYRAILADPPWDDANAVMGGYPALTMDELKDLNVIHAAAYDAACFIWCGSSSIYKAGELMKAWGFKYKTMLFVWEKVTRKGNPYFGMGYWSHSATEYVIMGIRGKVPRLIANTRQLVVAPVTRHSEKPLEVHRRIQKLVPGPYLELFARRPVPGWRVWGNEV